MPLVLTADELAERWKITKAQVWRLTREGKIPVLQLGKFYRYPLELIEAMEAQAECKETE